MLLCPESPIRVNPVITTSRSKPKVTEVVSLLKEKAERQKAYRLCEIVLDENFEITWADQPIRFSTASIKRLCATLGISVGLLKSESCRSTKAARRLTELVNDRLGDMDEGFTAVIDGGTVEGVLSPKYKRLPNIDAVEFTLARIDMGSHEIARFCMEETRMGLDIASLRNDSLPEQKALLKVGDPIRFGVSLFNSEDAEASVDMSAFIERLRCLNGATATEKNGSSSVRHIGRAFFERFASLLDHTQRTAASVFGQMMPMRETGISAEEGDVLHQIMAHHFSERMATRMFADAAVNADELKGALVNTGKHDPLTTEAGNLISVFNVWNGITYQGHDAKSLDARREVEAFGGAFLRQWHETVK